MASAGRPRQNVTSPPKDKAEEKATKKYLRSLTITYLGQFFNFEVKINKIQVVIFRMTAVNPKTSSLRLKKLLLINPNSSQSMTKGLKNLITDLGPSQTFNIIPYTAPSGPSSINNEDDAEESAKHVLADLEGKLGDYDAFLVACYSIHPLVSRIKERIHSDVHVMGIFEASITSALALLPQKDGKFGIVSTGSYWKTSLTNGVLEFLGSPETVRFKSVETTGLNAGELHTAPLELVRRKMKEATKRLVKDGDCTVICLGCAGMAGMDDIVREALVDVLGEKEAGYVRIVDGVKVGIGLLEGIVRALPDMRRERSGVTLETR